MSMRPSSVVQAGFLLLTLASGCRCSEEDPSRSAMSAPSAPPTDELPAPPVSREVIFWDFAAPPDAGLVALWPDASPKAERDPQGVTLSAGAESLSVVSSGPRPHIVWRFEAPVPATLLVLELDSNRPSTLAASWTGQVCPEWGDICRAELELGIGRRHFNVLFGERTPIKMLRFDLAPDPELRLEIFALRLAGAPRAASTAASPHAAVIVRSSDRGLEIASSTDDPGVLLPVSGLSAASVESVELEFAEGARARPQLFWTGTACKHFSEECSLWLPAGPEPERFQARMTGVGNFTGRIDMLRLDPSNTAGSFVVRRLSLVRAGAGK